MGCAKQRGSECAGRDAESRNNCKMVVREDNPRKRRKPTRWVKWKAVVPKAKQGELTGHHRDPRPGHVHRGAAHELGRAYCLLGGKTAGGLGAPANQESWRRASRTCSASSHRKRWNTNEGGNKVLGRERKRTAPRWAEAVLAERSTEGRGEKAAAE